MDLKTDLTRRLEQALEKYLAAEAAKKGGGEALDSASVQIAIETPRNPEHGDFATNVAMLLSRPLRRNPMQIAEEFLAHLDREGLIREAAIAKPGFINFRVESGAAANVLRRIAEQGAAFGHTRTGSGTRVLIEFVSANPTGPLHIGHARNAVVGDVLGRVLAAAGFEVSREYYFNDAGVQMDMLGNTLRLRVREQLGRPIVWPAPKKDEETGELHAQYYKGDYMKDIARAMIAEIGAETAGAEHPTAFYTAFAVREILKMIEADLEAMGWGRRALTIASFFLSARNTPDPIFPNPIIPTFSGLRIFSHPFPARGCLCVPLEPKETPSVFDAVPRREALFSAGDEGIAREFEEWNRSGAHLSSLQAVCARTVTWIGSWLHFRRRPSYVSGAAVLFHNRFLLPPRHAKACTQTCQCSAFRLHVSSRAGDTKAGVSHSIRQTS